MGIDEAICSNNLVGGLASVLVFTLYRTWQYFRPRLLHIRRLRLP